MAPANDSVGDVLDGLSSDDPEERVIMLQVLSQDPTGAKAVLDRVRELMTDRTPVILSVPYEYGEVRYMAARALVAEHRAAGIADPVVLADVPSPLGTDELATLQDRAGMRRMAPLVAYAELRQRGDLPLTTVELDPAGWPFSAQVPAVGGGMASDDVVAETLESLAGDDASVRAGALLHLRRYPTGSPEVAAAVRAMLTDLTPVNVDVPYIYGELRWAAAHALAAEHRAGSVAEPVVLADVPGPLSDVDMEPLAKAAGLGDREPPAVYAALRERNLTPLTTITLTGAEDTDGGEGPDLVELTGRVLRFADWARAAMRTEFGVRYVSEIAMKARLREIERRGTCSNGLRYEIHGNGYDVYAAEGVSLTVQGHGYARADRPTGPDDGVYDYIDLYALRDFLRDWAATTADLDALAEACAEHCRRGVVRDAGDLRYELITIPSAPSG